jgi:hypothetical protein
MEDTKTMHDSKPDFNEFLDPLLDDLINIQKLLAQSDSQWGRRALVRATFAYMEGSLSWLSPKVQELVRAKGMQGGTIDIARIVALADRVYRPNNQGKIESEANRVPFISRYALVIRTAAECVNVDPAPLFSDNGWGAMGKALKVRHRITHPKVPAELDVTDGEMETLDTAMKWSIESLRQIVDSSGFDALKAYCDRHWAPAAK